MCRRTGSGNIGATNVARSSPALGLVTLVLDALKGLAAVALARAFFPGRNVLAGVAALFAILGHMFPVWLKFRGGKGVATGLGSFAILAPKTFWLWWASLWPWCWCSVAYPWDRLSRSRSFLFSHGCCTITIDSPQILVLMAIASVLLSPGITRIFAAFWPGPNRDCRGVKDEVRGPRCSR